MVTTVRDREAEGSNPSPPTKTGSQSPKHLGDRARSDTRYWGLMSRGAHYGNGI